MRGFRAMPAIAALLLVTGLVTAADAMPPHPSLAQKSAATAAGLDRYNELRASFAARGINQPEPIAAGAQVAGNFNVLAVCVDFSDHVAVRPAAEFDTLIFDSGAGSVRDYYLETSYGTLTIVTVDLPSAIGCQRAPQTYAYYVNGNYGMGSYPQNSQGLIEDHVNLIDGVVDFSQYDNDSDGDVDGLVVIHSGVGAEYSGDVNDMWSHKWNANWPRPVKDGKEINAYSVQPEYWLTPGDITIGVYAHEIGHLFGLPDLYDTGSDSRGLGRWSLMASGSWNGPLSRGSSPAHFDVWCKTQLGWVTPTVIATATTGASVPQIETNAVAYKVWEDGSPTNEYYLVENRQKVGYDLYIPGDGLCVYHIDENQPGNDNQWYPGYTSFGNYKVALEQADGLWQMEQNSSYGDAGDPFPGTTDNRMFAGGTTPNSDAYDGTPTYVTITNISNSGTTMTCDFTVSLGSGILDEGGIESEHDLSIAGNHPNPFNPATTITLQSDGSSGIALEIVDILGRRIRTLPVEPVEVGMQAVSWDGNDDNGEPVASGVYFARLNHGGIGGATAHKMVLVR